MAEKTGGQKSPSLRELALLFLKLGSIGFGGPAAHIAMMEDEIVRRRRWMTRDDFLDLLGATTSFPVPTQPRWRSTSDTANAAGQD